MGILPTLVYLYSLCIFGRIVLSWFPISRGSPLEPIFSALYSVTEPVLGPVRRALPPLGGFDLSPIVVIIGLQLLSSALARG
ncbi:MAG TPA: YggT family protein [Acidimicrobiales bacterium]|nr:YggT family protein [Acidimicrobiales bacterium]